MMKIDCLSGPEARPNGLTVRKAHAIVVGGGGGRGARRCFPLSGIIDSMRSQARITIAGLRGGSGKTTVSLAIIAGLRAQGVSVSPFKKGPDYIDAGWLSLAAGSPCYTLDPFLIPSDAILQSFARHHTGDIAVIEGNRGLHDGKDVLGSCSTAEIAKLLQCPVILVVDCTKMTRTAAALVLGCMKLDESVQIKGVVINQVSSERHASVVRESIEAYCGISVIGSIPRFRAGRMPERHMGLTPHQERDDAERTIALAEDIARTHLDLSRIVEIAQGSPVRQQVACHSSWQSEAGKGSRAVRIGVLRDAAFQFYYPENIESLEARGAVIVPVDALQAQELPEIDALYIGGGFPETNAIRLSENSSFRASVRAAADRGMPIYAECGGLMFLGEAIVLDGTAYPMAGVFPLTFAMHKRPRAHGYSVALVDRPNPFYPVGTRLQGHEFHYSAVSTAGTPEGISYAFAMERGEGIIEGRDGICYRNVLATYTHTHALGTPLWAEGMIRKAEEYHS